MSVRIEWSTAEATDVSALERGDIAEDGCRVTEDLCLMLGAQAIEGTYDELTALLSKAVVSLRQMEDDEYPVVESRAIRDLAVQSLTRHERDEHGGERCGDQRVGMLAFLGHALGLRPEHMDLVAVELFAYNASHDLHHGPQS